MGKGRLTTWIDRREALPVRAIPFITGWTMSPDKVAAVLAHNDSTFQTGRGVPLPLTAHHLEDGKPRPMLPKTWDNVCGMLTTLSSNLVTEAWDNAKKIAEPHQIEETDPCPDLELEEVLALAPAELERVLELLEACGDNEPNANIRRIAHQLSRDKWLHEAVKCLPAGVFVWRDEFEAAFKRASNNTLIAGEERPGDRELDFSPWLPEEMRQVVMDGFVDDIFRPVEQARLVEEASDTMPTSGLAAVPQGVPSATILEKFAPHLKGNWENRLRHWRNYSYLEPPVFVPHGKLKGKTLNLWNPARFGWMLAGRKRLDGTKPNQQAIHAIIEHHFDKWFDEWCEISGWNSV